MTVVLVGHGTRSVEGQAVGVRLRAAVADRLPHDDVRWAWVDVVPPLLPDVLAEVPEAIVVPIFLASGYHVEVDIPAAVTQTGGHAQVTSHVGPDLVAAVAELLRAEQAATGQQAASVVLGAAGSSRPDALTEVHAAAAALAEQLGLPVRAAFATQARPTLDEAVTAARAEHGGPVAMASWILAPGHFYDRLGAAGADLQTAPVAVHDVLISAILRRITDARNSGLAQPPAGLGHKVG